MIKNLSIKNFILIDELRLNFANGFNVFTGETGAGKSIIINAIDIIFGAKASKDLIKTGKELATLELELKLGENFPYSLLIENGIEFEGEDLIVSREITQTSSRSRVNGSLVTQDFIKKLRELIIDIHSQHQTYAYIQPKHHIKLLDAFGNDEHQKALYSYSNAYHQFCETKRKLENAKNGFTASEQEIDFLKFQINEIEEAQINDTNEDEALEKELEILSNAETLKDLTYSSYWALYGDDTNIIEALSTIKTNIAKACSYDEELQPYEEEVIGVLETLKDTASFLRNYADNVNADYERIDKIQERIEMLNKVKRKYGGSLESVVEQLEKLQKHLDEIDFSKDDIENFEKELEQMKNVLEEYARRINLSRVKMAETLSVAITEELQKLELPKSRFKIDVEMTETFLENGKDKVEFLISTNVSESVKPLAKIASGGEISRVMLALKTIFAKTDNINTVIFDEIDTGISGSAAQAVSEELVELAKSHQVISITHLPIIAAKAPKYFYVRKSQTDSTKIEVFDLDEENKIKALALMASGEMNEESLNFARGLLRV